VIGASQPSCGCSRCHFPRLAVPSTGVFAIQAQEVFLAGNRYALERLDGVPVGRICYDNVKPAVARVLFAVHLLVGPQVPLAEAAASAGVADPHRAPGTERRSPPAIAAGRGPFSPGQPLAPGCSVLLCFVFFLGLG
jgi:hypothetical protein